MTLLSHYQHQALCPSVDNSAETIQAADPIKKNRIINTVKDDFLNRHLQAANTTHNVQRMPEHIARKCDIPLPIVAQEIVSHVITDRRSGLDIEHITDTVFVCIIEWSK